MHRVEELVEASMVLVLHERPKGKDNVWQSASILRLFGNQNSLEVRAKLCRAELCADWNKPPTAPILVAIRSVDGERIPKMK